MHINLTERRTFTAEIPGRTIDGLVIDSEWNGLTKFLHPASGLYLIVMREEGIIVDGSKSLIDDLLAPTVVPEYIQIRGRTITIGDYDIKVEPFKVAKYMNFVDQNGKAAVCETATPRVRINFADSKTACSLAGGGLLRGSQHLAIAMDIMSVDANWSGGKVGAGALRRGLHRGTVSGAQAGNYVSLHPNENRWFTLPDGQGICDFAGHLYSWMFDDIHGDDDGLSGKIPADSPYLTIGSQYSQYSQYSQSQGMGYRPDGARERSGDALVRGGFWLSGGCAGVFRLGFVRPDYEYGSVGFRCTIP